MKNMLAWQDSDNIFDFKVFNTHCTILSIDINSLLAVHAVVGAQLLLEVERRVAPGLVVVADDVVYPRALMTSSLHIVSRSRE